MNSRKFLRAFPSIAPIVLFFVLIVLLLLDGGCFSHHDQSNARSPVSPLDAPHDTAQPTTRPDSMDAAVDAPSLLAQRTEAYSRSMEAALARRTTSPASAEPNTGSLSQASPPQASLVQWGDPSDLRLSLTPVRQHTIAPVIPAVVETSPTVANQPTSAANVVRTAAVSAPAATPANADAPPTDGGILSNAAITSNAGASAVPAPIDLLEQKLSRRIHDYPHDVSGQLDYQLLQFIMDQPVPQLSAISSMSSEDREMIAAVCDGLSNFRNNLRADNNMLLSRKIKPLLEMADRLRSQADLTISTLALCKEVKGFGNYVPWEGDPPKFTAGVAQTVVLYCEIQNFCSQLDDKKLWSTQLTQDVVLYTENGMAVWNGKTQTVNDTARNRRQDFFVAERVTLPASLVIGRYLLKVSVEDKQAKRVAEATLPLAVVAQ